MRRTAIVFGETERVSSTEDVQRFSVHLGKEIEADLSWDFIGNMLRTFTIAQGSPSTQVRDPITNRIIGLSIDLDDEPFIEFFAAYMSGSLNNEITALAMTRALHGYADERPNTTERISTMASGTHEYEVVYSDDDPVDGFFEGFLHERVRVEREHQVAFIGTLRDILHSGGVPEALRFTECERAEEVDDTYVVPRLLIVPWLEVVGMGAMEHG